VKIRYVRKLSKLIVLNANSLVHTGALFFNRGAAMSMGGGVEFADLAKFANFGKVRNVM
jgi:hypothetical protein